MDKGDDAVSREWVQDQRIRKALKNIDEAIIRIYFFQKGAFFMIALQKLNIKDTVSYKIMGAMSLSSQLQYWFILCSKN